MKYKMYKTKANDHEDINLLQITDVNDVLMMVYNYILLRLKILL